MTPMQAIQSATIVAASLLDQQNDIGSIDVGKLADIVAVTDDPLRDISALERISFVMKAGKVYK